MFFSDRQEAGRRLAGALRDHLSRDEDAVIFALPRGGVIVAREVARRLGRPLDLVVIRKIGAPRNEEFAVGAVGEDGVPVFSREAIEATGASPAHLVQAIEAARQEVRRRTRVYRVGPRAEIEGKTAVIVDDGIATGLTIEAAIDTVRRWGARRVVIAAPVAPRQTVLRLRARVDDVVVLDTPEEFFAVGQFYADFRQVEDREVTAALEDAGAAVLPRSV